MKKTRILLSLVLFFLLTLSFVACGGEEKAPVALPVGFENARIPNINLDGYVYLSQGAPFNLGSGLALQGEMDQVAAFLTPKEDEESLWFRANNKNWQNAQSTASTASGNNAILIKEGYLDAWNLMQQLPSNPPHKIIGTGFLNINPSTQKWLSEITRDPQTVKQLGGILEQAQISQIAIGLYSEKDLAAIDFDAVDVSGLSILAVGKSSYPGVLLSPLLSIFGPEEDKIGETTVYAVNLGNLNLVIRNVGSYIYVSISPNIAPAKDLLASVLAPENKTTYLKRQLAEKYAPILYMHPEGEYEPKDVRIMIDNAELKMKPWMTLIPLNQPLTPLDLYNVSQNEKSEDLYLDIRGINLAEFEGAKFQGAWAYLQKYREIRDNYPTTVYAHVFTYKGKTIIQYWLFYFFNDGPENNHEGDWEYVQINLNGTDPNQILNSNVPELAVYSQHLSEGKKKWAEVATASGHPLVYVAKGSHANYFSAGEWSIDSTSGNGKIIFPPMQSERQGRENYKLVILPEPSEDARIKQEQPWLAFRGDWGQWLPPPAKWAISGPQSIATRTEWDKPLIK